MRAAPATSVSARARHTAIGSSSSSRSTCSSSRSSRASASAGSRSGNTSSAHAGVGHGAIVQFDRAVVDDLDALLDRRQAVLADQDGIEIGQQRPAPTGRTARCARACASPSARIRSPYHGGTKSSVSGLACSIRARLMCGSNHADVHEPRPVPVRAGRERADQVLLAGLARRRRRSGPAARSRRSRSRGRRSARGWRRPYGWTLLAPRRAQSRTSSPCGRWAGGAAACACWLSWATAARRMRETCICEQPMRRPISAWVSSSRNRSWTARASRLEMVASRSSSVAVVSAPAKPGSSAPSRSASVVASSPSSGASDRSKESLPRAWPASAASRMSSIVQPSRWASSAAVGLRRRSLVS